MNDKLIKTKEKLSFYQKQFFSQQEALVDEFYQQLQHEYAQIEEERNQLAEKERIVLEKAKENDRISKELSDRDISIQKEKQLLLQRIKIFSDREQALDKKESEQNERYRKLKEYFEIKQRVFQEMEQKYQQKATIIEQKEKEIIEWENSHLFRDMLKQREEMRLEFEQLKRQKELFQQQINEQQLILRRHSDLEKDSFLKKQLEMERKEEVLSRTLESIRTRENELLQVEKSLATSVGINISQNGASFEITMPSATASESQILKEEVSPIHSVMFSEEKQDNFLSVLQKEQEDIEHLKELLIKQSSEMLRTEDKTLKTKRESGTFTFKVPDDILSTTKSAKNKNGFNVSPPLPSILQFSAEHPVKIANHPSTIKPSTPDPLLEYLTPTKHPARDLDVQNRYGDWLEEDGEYGSLNVELEKMQREEEEYAKEGLLPYFNAYQ